MRRSVLIESLNLDLTLLKFSGPSFSKVVEGLSVVVSGNVHLKMQTTIQDAGQTYWNVGLN